MASRTRNAGRTAFLSPEMTAFLGRRLSELGGLVLFLCGLALTIAVLGYDSSDPSWNHSVARDALNPMGGTGAVVADAIVQSIGAAATVSTHSTSSSTRSSATERRREPSSGRSNRSFRRGGPVCCRICGRPGRWFAPFGRGG